MRDMKIVFTLRINNLRIWSRSESEEYKSYPYYRKPDEDNFPTVLKVLIPYINFDETFDFS